MARVLIIGASGMAGHLVHLFLLEKQHEVLGIARTFPKALPNTLSINLRDLEVVAALIRDRKFDVVVNCAGILNVAADTNREEAIFINSFIPHWLSKVSPRVIHLSTDCVFSGAMGGYTEDAPPDGPTFYDRTKAIGELINSKDLTLRQSIVGPELSTSGIGLLNWYLIQSGAVKGYKNAVWNGVTTLELAKGIEFAISNKKTGLHHMVQRLPVTKFELLHEFRRVFNCKVSNIEAFENMPRVDKSLVSTRSDFGFFVSAYRQQMVELRSWMEQHANLYDHYTGITKDV